MKHLLKSSNDGADTGKIIDKNGCLWRSGRKIFDDIRYDKGGHFVMKRRDVHEMTDIDLIFLVSG